MRVTTTALETIPLSYNSRAAMTNNDNLSDDDEFDLEGVDSIEDVTPETLETIATLKSSLALNPLQYELHTQLIKLLKTAAMLEELRDARNAMHRAYPLSEELWMDWIQDESNMAASEDEKRHVLSLYERATADYLSILIWKSYLEYAVQEYKDSLYSADSEVIISKDDLASLFSKANKFTGYHVSQSHQVWDIWKDFELEQLASQESAKPEDVNRVKSMFMDRIAVPHLELESTFSSLSSFITQYDGADYENAMVQSNKVASATRKTLSDIEPYEQQLVATGNSFPAFTAYLSHELKKNRMQFARIRTLYERTVTVHCLVPSVWNDYISYLMPWSHQKKEHDLTPADVISIAERSVRNCPWSGDLWENHVLILEAYLKPEEEIYALSDSTLLLNAQEVSKVLLAQCSYKLWHANADADGHKAIREAFEYALAVLEAAGGDPYCKVERLWIDLESGKLGDHQKARELWKSIESRQKTLSEFWISQAEMEKRLDNVKGTRQIFARACNVATMIDWPEKVFETWLMFEREKGDVVSFKDALVRTRSAMKSVEALRAQSAAAEALATAVTYAEQTAYESLVAQQVPVTASASTSAAAVEQPVGGTENGPRSQISSKKRKLPTQDGEHLSKISKTDEEQSTANPVDRSQTAAKPLNISAGRHEDTCFVANFLDDMTEKKLTELFQEYGTVLRCTIPPPRNGDLKKRSFAYVQFSSPEEAHAALALDGRDVGQRRGLSVKISDTTQKTRGKAGEAPLPRVSRHEVHISGITNELKEEELEKLVSLYARPTSVFIQRLAHSKGTPWANIKFENELDADAALALNGTVFHGKPLNVTRRVFQKTRLQANAGAEDGEGGEGDHGGLTRKERRRLKQQQAEGAEATSSVEHHGADSKHKSTIDISSDAKASAPQESSTTPTLAATGKRVTTSLTSMQPRSMAPRSLQPRNVKPSSHMRPPARAFKSAATGTSTSAVAGSSEGLTGNVGGTESEGSTPAPPKSNAEFRALMLSGTLKKKT